MSYGIDNVLSFPDDTIPDSWCLRLGDASDAGDAAASGDNAPLRSATVRRSLDTVAAATAWVLPSSSPKKKIRLDNKKQPSTKAAETQPPTTSSSPSKDHQPLRESEIDETLWLMDSGSDLESDDSGDESGAFMSQWVETLASMKKEVVCAEEEKREERERKVVRETEMDERERDTEMNEASAVYEPSDFLEIKMEVEEDSQNLHEHMERLDGEFPRGSGFSAVDTVERATTLQSAMPLSDVFSWSANFNEFTSQEETYQRTPGPQFYSNDPVEIFLHVWDGPIMEMIVAETNRYAQQVIRTVRTAQQPISKGLDTWKETTVEELYRYFAVLIYMSICLKTDIREYWTTSVLGMPEFRKLMSRNRFIELSRFLHFVNNEFISSHMSSYQNGKLFKIIPILKHCNEKFSSMYTPMRHLSLDESLLLWKGLLSWVQAIRSKAARFGMKFFDLCEAATGYLLQTRLYAGKDAAMHAGPIQGFDKVTAKIVLDLLDGYLDAGHCIVMDNWYNQLPLTRYLKSRSTDVIGTMNRNRAHVPTEIKSLSDRQLKRGDQVARHCGDVTLISWKDVKLVTAISTFHNAEQVPAGRAGQDLMKPRVICEYNKYMGGVDSKDQKLSMYLLERKQKKKWYIKVFHRLLNTSLLNAYIIYLRAPLLRPLSHREFRHNVAAGLVRRFMREAASVPSSAPLSSGITVDVLRLDRNLRHFPVYTEVRPGTSKLRQRNCARCTAAGERRVVTHMCGDCKVPLCLGRCWREYHELDDLKK